MSHGDTQQTAPGLLRVVVPLGILVAAVVFGGFALRGCGNEKSPQAQATSTGGAGSSKSLTPTDVPAARSNDPVP